MGHPLWSVLLILIPVRITVAYLKIQATTLFPCSKFSCVILFVCLLFNQVGRLRLSDAASGLYALPSPGSLMWDVVEVQSVYIITSLQTQRQWDKWNTARFTMHTRFCLLLCVFSVARDPFLLMLSPALNTYCCPFAPSLGEASLLLSSRFSVRLPSVGYVDRLTSSCGNKAVVKRRSKGETLELQSDCFWFFMGYVLGTQAAFWVWETANHTNTFTHVEAGTCTGTVNICKIPQDAGRCLSFREHG